VTRTRVVDFDAEAGDIPARQSVLCQHGTDGYCYDDALPEEREAVDFIHRHAFDYAVSHEGPDLAEEYAAWCVRTSWHPGVLVLGGSHRVDFARFLADRIKG
jgi:hypothetical protein